MTTINNLTIEQMREIVSGAPTWAIWWCVDKKKFIDFIPCSKCLVVKDLRTAIAEHDNTDHVTDIRNHLSPSTKVIEHE